MLHFIGELNSSDRNELNLRGRVFSDTRQEETGMAGLRAALNDDSGHIKSKATDVFDPIYVVKPAKTTSTDLLKIVLDFHKGISCPKVYYDDFGDAPACVKSELEKSLKVMEESGIRVYRGIEEVVEEDTTEAHI